MTNYLESLKKNHIVFCVLVISFMIYLRPTITSMLLDNSNSNKTRGSLIGSWKLVDGSDGASYLGADGKVISFDRYLLYTSHRVLPQQYVIKYIPYNRKRGDYHNLATVVLSSSDKFDEWMEHSYAITSITADTLKLVPTFMILASRMAKEYTFKKLDTK
ncbi:hypothetical protein ACTJKN_25855 [Pedobacter sp. 22163]|uniref:hypothetical protein n=1 Tax=Pedobacter sp. 22163 TaxID=3453883 RepID=UPI003F84498F